MAGNQSRGLVAASKTKGWDPMVIPAAPGKPAQSLTDFDVDQGNLAGNPVGRIPGGPPSTTIPEATDTVFTEKVTFSTPDYSRENAARRTSGANPFAGMGGE